MNTAKIIQLASHPQASRVRQHARELGAAAALILDHAARQQAAELAAEQAAPKPAKAAEPQQSLPGLDGRHDQKLKSEQQEKRAVNQDAERERILAVRASHWTGSKYQQGRDIAEVAKDVRKDLRAAVKARQLPKGFKASVRIERYSMGRSLNVVVKAAPGVQIFNDTYLAAMGKGLSWPPSDRAAWPKHGRFTAEGVALQKTVEDICNAYNYDRSDSMTDYYNTAFHLDFRWAL
jgi:hypothetical protein